MLSFLCTPYEYAGANQTERYVSSCRISIVGNKHGSEIESKTEGSERDAEAHAI